MKALKWIACNGVFAALLYFGFYEQVEGALNVSLGIAWTASILSLFFLNDEVVASIRKKGFSVPYWVDFTFDLAVAGLLLWHGFFTTAIVYIIHMVIIASVRYGKG